MKYKSNINKILSDEEILSGAETSGNRIEEAKKSADKLIESFKKEPAKKQPAPKDPISFSVSSAPENTFTEHKKTSSEIADDILNKIGVGPGGRKPTEEIKKEFVAPRDLHLNSKQQKWCDDATPMIVYLFGGLMGFLWALPGEEYTVLRPTEEVCEKILAPLVRIYARTVKTLDIVNPNYIDATASITALGGYAMICWQNLQMIRRMKEEDDGRSLSFGNQSTSTDDYFASRTAGKVEPPVQNSKQSHQSNSSNRNGHINAGNGGTTTVTGLTPEQRFQYEQLSRLRDIDTTTRARQQSFFRDVWGEVNKRNQ